MTREEFFAKLDARLSVLNESERRDIIEEYQSHIEFKIQDGKTEAQAISDFGDIDALADEILEAYHIDNNATKNKSLEYYIKKCVGFINDVTERILSLSVSDIAKIIVEFFVVLLAIWLLSIPVDMVSSTIRSTIYGFSLGGISNMLAGIVNLFAELINLAVAFLIVYSFIKTRVMTRTPVIPKYEHKKEKDCFADGNSAFDYEDTNFDVNTGKPLKSRKTIADVGKSSGDFIVRVIAATLKICLFVIVWLPAVICTIGFIVVSVLLVLLMVTQGIGLWSICLICAGCGIISLGTAAWMTEVIFGGRNKNEA
ncbi:MAG: DUF1700 domain-containing protein [Oscillospiraceae bacterium]|nr:DUF1700 domain-containing protein [Oscillospiraceae bacterium]